MNQVIHLYTLSIPNVSESEKWGGPLYSRESSLSWVSPFLQIMEVSNKEKESNTEYSWALLGNKLIQNICIFLIIKNSGV